MLANFAGCHKVLENSLFILGEIGGNDFNQPLHSENNITKLKTNVPRVVNAITSTVNVRLFSFAKYMVYG
jgi:hypothetical protein